LGFTLEGESWRCSLTRLEDAKARPLVISAVGVPACFAVGYALTRTPGVTKVL
jgi:hypothetical protein